MRFIAGRIDGFAPFRAFAGGDTLRDIAVQFCQVTTIQILDYLDFAVLEVSSFAESNGNRCVNSAVVSRWKKVDWPGVLHGNVDFCDIWPELTEKGE